MGSKGEIDEYSGVEIEWIRGKKAIMTLFDDSGTQLEEIKLYKLNTREEMHTLMVEKGFSKKTESQKVADIQLEKMEKRIGSSPGTSSVMGTLSALYFVIFGVLAGKSIVNRCLRKLFRVVEIIYFILPMSNRYWIENIIISLSLSLVNFFFW